MKARLVFTSKEIKVVSFPGQACWQLFCLVYLCGICCADGGDADGVVSTGPTLNERE